jgi:hypothetical protein
MASWRCMGTGSGDLLYLSMGTLSCAMSGLPLCEHKPTHTSAFIPHNLPREALLAGAIVIVH